jgi:ubiquitin-activating enzyme E1 C
MDWVHTRALARAAAHGIPPFPRALTAGVAKRIVPAIASTNAIVAAACALEALKAATLLAPGLNNYMLFTGGDGVYAATQEHARDGACAVCSPGVPLAAPGGTLLGDWLERVRTEPALASLARGEGGLAGPTVATGDGAVLAGGGVYAEETAANRGRPLAVLLAGEGPHALVLNDRTLPAPVRVRLTLT